MTKYFIDTSGNYLGGFDGAEPPAGSVEVAAPPEDARQIWNGSSWGALPAPPANMDLFLELFAKETLLGAFTPEQHGTMKLIVDIKQDIAFRDQVLLNAMAGGTAEQKSRLLDIAQASGVKLPLP